MDNSKQTSPKTVLRLGVILTVSLHLLLASNMVDAAIQEIWLPGATGSGPFQVAQAWVTAFRVEFPEARLTFSSIGSGSAQKAMWGNIDCANKPVADVCAQETVKETLWGFGDAPMDPNAYGEHPEMKLQQMPACAGAVAVVYSNENRDESQTGPLRLTIEVIAGIMNRTIAYFDDDAIVRLNPDHDLPHEPIAVVVRQDSSGQTSIITDSLHYHVPSWPDEAVGKAPEWPLGELVSPNEFTRSAVSCTDVESNTTRIDTYQHFHADGKRGVGMGMLRVPYSIGYMEVGYAAGLSDFLSQAQVGIQDDFVTASAQSIQSSMAGLADQLDPETLELNLASADTPPGGYPIAGYAYWYLKRSASSYESCYQAWLLCQFVKWSYTDPKAAILAEQNDWIVPPQEVANITLHRLEQVMCLDTETSPPRVIPALSYVPPPYRAVVAEQEKVSILVLILVPLAFVCIMVIVFMHELARRKQMDSDHIWKVSKEELKFDSPIQIIGSGSFGEIVLAEYRGTQVAVKRLIAPAVDPETVRKTGSVQLGVVKSDSKVQGSSMRGALSGGKTAFWEPINKSRSKSKRSSRTGYAMMDRELFIQEMRILSKIRHPCIATVMGAVLERNTDPMLLMEFCQNGSLYDILHNETMPLDGDLLLPMLQDIVSGVRFLHAADPQVVHGDLKAKNILVDAKFRAKVSDFGISAKHQDGGVGGTPYWMAPEVLLRQSKNTPESDMYSFGIILYEVFSRKDPYEGEVYEKVIEQVCEPLVQKRPPIPYGMPLDVQSIMRDCLKAEPNRRPTSEELDIRFRRISENTQMLSGASQHSVLKPKQSNVSLFDLFPREVAEALRDGRKVQPQHKECVSIFFSDVVNFTELSASLHPHKVSSLLDRLYTVFDNLSHKYDIFKVETVGDSYMAVTNLVKNQEKTHAKRIALFAIEAVNATQSIPIDPEDPSLGNVQIRVGFHSGPVVANVVGNRSPRYCLFGDTVNTASRMESNSVPTRIQCSRKSFTLLRRQMPELEVQMRGRINVKGKNSMVTYFIADSEHNRSLAANVQEIVEPDDDESTVRSSKKRTPRESDINNNNTHSMLTSRSTHSTHTVRSKDSHGSRDRGNNNSHSMLTCRSTHSTHTVRSKDSHGSRDSDFRSFLRQGIAKSIDEEDDDSMRSFGLSSGHESDMDKAILLEMGSDDDDAFPRLEEV